MADLFFLRGNRLGTAPAAFDRQLHFAARNCPVVFHRYRVPVKFARHRKHHGIAMNHALGNLDVSATAPGNRPGQFIAVLFEHDRIGLSAIPACSLLSPLARHIGG